MTEAVTETPETPRVTEHKRIAGKTTELDMHDVYNLVRGLSVLSAEKANPQDVRIFTDKGGCLHFARMDANHTTMTDVVLGGPDDYTDTGTKRDTDTSPDKVDGALTPDNFQRLLTWCDKYVINGEYARADVYILPKQFIIQQSDTTMPGGKVRPGARLELPLTQPQGAFVYPAMGDHRAYSLSVEHVHKAASVMKAFDDKRVAIHIRAREPSAKYTTDADDNQYLQLCIGTHASWDVDAVVRVPLTEPASPPLALLNPDGSELERETAVRVGNMAAYRCEYMSNQAFKRLVVTSRGARAAPFKRAVLRINKNGLCLWDFIGHGFRTSYWIAPVVDY